MDDLISRQAAIDAIRKGYPDAINSDYKDGLRIGTDRAIYHVEQLPPAQPEITDEQAIEHLQSTGWMQNHDREMYESGLRERLADDSGSYDSLIPCEDTISRQAAIDAALEDVSDKRTHGFNAGVIRAVNRIKSLPSAQPEQRWIPCSERLPEKCKEVLVCYDFKGHRSVLIGTLYGDESFHGYDDEYLTPEGRRYRKAVAWMPLPEPYREKYNERT